MAAGGPPSHTSTTGVDTVFDPRVGRGSFVTPGLTTGQLIRAEVDGRLTYSLPLFNAGDAAGTAAAAGRDRGADAASGKAPAAAATVPGAKAAAAVH